ncbi:MAG: thiamine pyrophosphate-dependent enzyme [Acidobacteriota bacterium]
MALYRNLLRRTARAMQNKAEISRYPAAEVAMEMDLRQGDMVRVAVGRTSGRSSSRSVPTTCDLADVLGVAALNMGRKNHQVAVVWAAQADREALRDGLEAARVCKLPIVFVTEVETRAARLLNRKVAPGDEMPHVTVDGNDVIAAYRVAHEAIDRARRGRGPSLIECETYRVQGQRSDAHLDPVANLERYLHARGVDLQMARRKPAARKRS